MPSYAIIDGDGWVDGIVTTECGFNPEDYNATNYVEIPGMEVERIKGSQLTMHHDGEKFCQIKDPKTIWKRIRGGFGGRFGVQVYKAHLEQRDESYPDISGVIIPEPLEVKHMHDPIFEKEFNPDLKICRATDGDVDIWVSAMVNSTLFTKEEAWTQAAGWLSDPNIWCIKTVWKGEIIQVETYHFSGETVEVGFTSHIGSSRPTWFWRQMAKPVFEAFYGHGFETLKTSIRKDRRDWAENLKKIYGAKELRETDKGIHLKYKIEATLALIGDWPERKTLGVDWRWKKQDIEVREATEGDLPALYSAIDADWGTNPRKELALKRINESWELDRGAILLGFKEDKIINARAYIERTEPTLNLSVFPLRSKTGVVEAIPPEVVADNIITIEGFNDWQKAVGYTVTSFILETNLFTPNVEQVLGRGWVIYSQNDKITDCRYTL